MAEKLEAWITQVGRWKGSGLSAAAWCRENGVDYPQFLYWRERIAKRGAESFVELTDAKSSEESGIELEAQGVTVRLTKGFDSFDLLRCLRVIGAMAC